jgi:hypothetical protein
VEQPVVRSVYVITVDTLLSTPPTTMPVVAPTVAATGLLLTHLPPDGTPVSVMVSLIHTAEGPIIDGRGSTMTVAVPVIVRKQPVTVFVATTV